MTAKEFRVVNDQGVAVASIKEKDGHGELVLSDGSLLPDGKSAIKVHVSAKPGATRIGIFNKAGKLAAVVSCDESGEGSVMVSDGSGDYVYKVNRIAWNKITPGE